MTEKNLTLYIRRFFSGTLLSRISGMVRDLTMAFAFGDHPSVAAFMVAFRLSNLLRRLLGEGPFQSAFIPYFEGLRVQDNEKATLFFRQLTSLISLLLIALILLGEGGIFAALSAGNLSEGNVEIVSLTGWLLPGILFICLYGLNISLLNCYDTFFIPSFAPFVCNAIWIGAAFYLRNQSPAVAMPTLAKWVAIGFFGQWLLTVPYTLKHVAGRWRDWFQWKIPAEVKGLAKSFALGVIGVGAVQINALVDALFARYADMSGPTYLWYSIRLEQLALAVFGIACISTIVPRLSRAIKAGRLEEAGSLFGFSYKRIMAVMIPCTFAILVLGTAAVNLIYGRGHFSDLAISKTTLCLWAYGVGLVPTALVILFSAIFYAHNNFRLPMFISLITVALNMVLNMLFVWVWKMGAISTALATSLSALANCWILYKLTQKMGWKPGLSLSRFIQICAASLFAGLCTLGVDYLFFHSSALMPLLGSAAEFPRSVATQLAHFFTLLSAFGGGLILYAFAFKTADIQELVQEFLFKRAST